MSGMSQRFDTANPTEREAGVAAAALAVQRGQLVVLPTDTVYGVGADAFSPDAVRALLAAKGRGRDMPPPVLVSAATTLDALAVGVPTYARSLIEALWPGPLTLVCRQQPSLQWDLGDTRGTVAVRMPDHEVALDLLSRTGPLAVSSANRSGQPAGHRCRRRRGDARRTAPRCSSTPARPPVTLPSTIVDATGDVGTGAADRRRLARAAQRDRRAARGRDRRRGLSPPCASTSPIFLVAATVTYLLGVVRP